MKFTLMVNAAFIVTLIVVTSHAAAAAKILVYPFAHCLNSHLLIAENLNVILAEDGHQVDMIVGSAYDSFEHRITSRDDQRTINRYNNNTDNSSRHVVTTSKQSKGNVNLLRFATPDNYHPVCEYDSVDFMLDATLSQRFNGLFHTFVLYCDRLLADKMLMANLKSANYDLFITESIDPCGYILADYLDIPFVSLVTLGLGHFDPNPRPPSYLPAAIAPFTSDMNFGQRMTNVLIKLMYDVVVPSIIGFTRPFEELKRKYGLNTTLSLINTPDRASLRFVNSDFTVDYPAPIEPDNVLIGGFAINRNPPALPADLEQFVEGSGDDGVIVVSFGTLVRRYGQDRTRIFIEAFSRLPQRVIWRHYGDELEEQQTTSGSSNMTLISGLVGSNIRLMRWLPQASLLAHNKTRLFISHCGLNAILEATHYGVPVLAIPLSADQYHHAAKVSGPRLGMAITVDIRTMTADSLYADLRRILTETSYRENAKRMSRLMSDQLSSPADRIRYWSDYVIRHGGVHHLHLNASRRLSWYQYWSLDVGACLLVIVTTMLYVTYRLLRFAARAAGGVVWRICTNHVKVE